MRPQPLAIESPFEKEDVFFSKTDTKGIIAYGNKIFYDTAKYTPAELIGKPHNIVRHPDMPKAIFKLLWDYIKADKPFAGYVKNLAKDGSFYWVFAIVFPLYEGKKKEGYLSVRIKPTTKYFDIARSLYEKMRKLEASGESAEAFLSDGLAQLGYKSYDTFMIDALMAEFKDKEEHFHIDLGEKILHYPRMRTIYENCKAAESIYEAMYEKIAFYLDLSTMLEEKFTYIYQMTDDLSLIALNSSIESHKIGSMGASFAVVSNEIKKDSERIGRHIVELRKNIDTSVTTIKESVLYLLSLNIQIFAILYYMQETIVHQSCNEGECMDKVRDFIAVIRSSTQKVAELVKQLESDLNLTLTYIGKIERLIKELHYIQVNGLIESSKLQDEKFSIIFNQVQNLVSDTTATLEEIIPAVKTSIRYTGDIRANINEARYYLDNIR